MGKHLSAAIVAHSHPKCVPIEYRAGKWKLRRWSADRDWSYDGPQFSSGCGLEQPLAIREPTRVELHDEPLRHVLGAGVDSARGVHVVSFHRRYRTDNTIHLGVRLRDVVGLSCVGMPDVASRHSDRSENPARDEILPTQPGN